jgi:hypothetical protein
MSALPRAQGEKASSTAIEIAVFWFHDVIALRQNI